MTPVQAPVHDSLLFYHMISPIHFTCSIDVSCSCSWKFIFPVQVSLVDVSCICFLFMSPVQVSCSCLLFKFPDNVSCSCLLHKFSVHVFCSCLLFRFSVHVSCSCLLFKFPVHVSCSCFLFMFPIHGSCSCLLFMSSVQVSCSCFLFMSEYWWPFLNPWYLVYINILKTDFMRRKLIVLGSRLIQSIVGSSREHFNQFLFFLFYIEFFKVCANS